MSETTEHRTSDESDVTPETPETTQVTAKAGRFGLVGGVIKTARPRQWVKNVLVFAAPFFAFSKSTDRTGLLVDAIIAFVAFSLTASSVYLINDAIDVEADRAHPTKRNRPIAAGIVPVSVAYVASVEIGRAHV